MFSVYITKELDVGRGSGCVQKCRNTCLVVMVFLKGWGLSGASQINKISEIASFATYFLSLWPFRSDLKRGCD